MACPSRRWGTGSWPERLRSGDVAIVVLPYPAGRVGPAPLPPPDALSRTGA